MWFEVLSQRKTLEIVNRYIVLYTEHSQPLNKSVPCYLIVYTCFTWPPILNTGIKPITFCLQGKYRNITNTAYCRISSNCVYICIAHITIHLHMSYMYERNAKAQIVCFGHSAIHPYRPTFMRGNTYWLCIYNCLVLLFIRPHPYNSFLVLLGSKVKMRQGNGCRDVEEVNC